MLSYLFLVLLASQSGILCLDFLESLEGELQSVTGNVYVYVAQKLELNCTLDEKWTNWSSQNIHFYHYQPLNSEPDSPGPRCLDKQTHVSSPMSATLVINNITLDDAGEYSCHVGKSNCSKDELVGVANDVNVEYAPQNVTNLICVVEDWTERMECNWDHPVKYVKFTDISVTLHFGVKIGKVTAECPHQNETSCEWRNTVEFSASPQYLLRICVTNKKTNDSAQKMFKIETMKSVQPSPVINLEIKNLPERNGCLQLTWSHKKPSRDIIFRIKHKASGDEQFTTLENVTRNGIANVSAQNGASLSYVTCGYKPWTTHKFALDCYPAGYYSGYWSKPIIKEIITPQTAPRLGPQISQGSYVSDPCINHQRSVTIFWSDMEKEAQNGIITTVSVHVGKAGKPLWKGLNGHYSAAIELGCQKQKLRIFAHNEAGPSQVPSEILIPPAEAADLGLTRLFALALRAGIEFRGPARTPFLFMRRFELYKRLAGAALSPAGNLI